MVADFGGGVGDNLAGLPPDADSMRRCRPVKNRFLPTQEWSAWGRGIVGGFWRRCGRQFGNSAIRRRQRTTIPKYTYTLPFPPTDNNAPKYAHTLPSTTRPFLRRQESILTICRQRRRQFRRRCRPVKNRFLPTQEWSVGGRGIVGGFGLGDNLTGIRRFAAAAIYI